MTTLAPQISELARKPHPRLMTRVTNTPTVSDEQLHALLGNKPGGGLWTSTHTPHDRHLSDWFGGLHTPRSLTAISAGRRPAAHRRLFVLDVAPGASVLEIGSLADAIAFTERYRLHRVPSIRTLSPLITAEVTNWASVPFDGIHLAGETVDHIVYAMTHGEATDTAFHTWTTESTLWLNWRFSSIREVDE